MAAVERAHTKKEIIMEPTTYDKREADVLYWSRITERAIEKATVRMNAAYDVCDYKEAAIYKTSIAIMEADLDKMYESLNTAHE